VSGPPTTTDIAGVGGITLRVTEAGDPSRPTVVLCHGFPELAFSWRHQIGPLVDAGYHVLAPDQRGYGHSSAPQDVTAYGIENLCGDLLAILDHHGKDDAIFVGHDWGALIVWDLAKLHPDRVRAVVGVSVPFVQWPAPPVQLMRSIYGDRFFYILYFQQVGPPEAELEADVARTMAQVLFGASGAGMSMRAAPRSAADGGDRVPHVHAAATRAAVHRSRGAVAHGRRARALRERVHALRVLRPGQLLPQLRRELRRHRRARRGDVTMPSWFIGGELDPVNMMDPTGVERMAASLPDFRGHVIIPGVGHWTQQEAPLRSTRRCSASCAAL
jgi:pimeloyl-ACP methyl ester carboxylesterase